MNEHARGTPVPDSLTYLDWAHPPQQPPVRIGPEGPSIESVSQDRIWKDLESEVDISKGVSQGPIRNEAGPMPFAQDPGEDAGPSSKRRRVDSGPDSGSGPQYLNVSSDTEGRAAPGPPEQPPAQPRELEQPPTLEEFHQLLANQKKIEDIIPRIFQDLHMRAPGGFQSEWLTERLTERHGGRSLWGIPRSLQEEGRNSPFFREIQTDFQALRKSGGTEATLRKEWQGRS